MKYKYQVVAHSAYYPSSLLYETYEEALEMYMSIKGSSGEDCLVTLCKIEMSKGEDPVQPHYDWYLD